MLKILLVGLGGAAGSVLRYLCIVALPTAGSSFPWTIFAVNAGGCFLAGVILRLTYQSVIGAESSLFLMTGLLGGFTTYSAFSADTLTLLKNKQTLMALLYVTGTVVAAITSAAAGYWLCGILLRYLR